MLLSMTGQGEALVDHDGVDVRAEVRSVNNRFLKVTTRVSDCIGSLDHQIEAVVRKHLKRGSLQVTVHVRQKASSSDYKINRVALTSYLQQAEEVGTELGFMEPLNVGHFMMLPGVVEEMTDATDDQESLIESAKQSLELALRNLNTMRQTEGEAMANHMLASLVSLENLSQTVQGRAPTVIDDYRTRLENKVRQTLAQIHVAFEPADLLREVQIFADRADIREELTRLSSHYEQVREAISDEQSQGRKLDFLIQELLREINTIGSKANDALITKCVVEMKTIVEQMREIVQNVE